MKLNKFQKVERKNLKEYFGENLILRRIDRVTFAFLKTGPNRAKIAWAVRSRDEDNNHRKYGEFVALQRLYDGGMPIELYYGDMQEINHILLEMANYIELDI